jgi:hypothetical protein
MNKKQATKIIESFHKHLADGLTISEEFSAKVAEAEAALATTSADNALESGNIPATGSVVSEENAPATPVTSQIDAAVGLAKVQGESDARRIFTGAVQTETLMRDTVFAVCEKLNGDGRAAYLDGMKVGIVAVGLTKQYAARMASEFRTIFKASDITVTIPNVVQYAEDGKTEKKNADGETLKLDETWDKDSLKNLKGNWHSIVAKAREMQRVANPNSAGSGSETKNRLFSDKTYQNACDSIMLHTTGLQALNLLACAVTRVSHYYGATSESKKLSEQVARLEEMIVNCNAIMFPKTLAATATPTPAVSENAFIVHSGSEVKTA